MLNLIYLGKFVNTHGLKGEIRIISDFEYKEDVFKIGSKLYIDNKEFIISSYRKHKNYDMVTFEGINSIEQIEKYKNFNIYINREDYNFNFIYKDLIGMKVYSDGTYFGYVTEVLKNKLYPIMRIKNNKEYMIPYITEFVKNVDIKNKVITINYIKRLCDED